MSGGAVVVGGGAVVVDGDGNNAASSITSEEVLDWPLLLSGAAQSAPAHSDRWRAVLTAQRRRAK